MPIGATRLYYICFLNGTAIAAVVFVGLHYVFPAKAQKEWVAEQKLADGGKWRENRLHFRDKWDALAAEQSGVPLDEDAKMPEENVKEV